MRLKEHQLFMYEFETDDICLCQITEDPSEFRIVHDFSITNKDFDIYNINYVTDAIVKVYEYFSLEKFQYNYPELFL